MNVAGAPGERINQAIDEILRRSDTNWQHAHWGIVSLPSRYGRIDLVDHVRGFRAELEKRETSPLECLSDGVVLRRQRTTRKQSALDVPTESVDLDPRIGGWPNGWSVGETTGRREGTAGTSIAPRRNSDTPIA